MSDKPKSIDMISREAALRGMPPKDLAAHLRALADQLESDAVSEALPHHLLLTRPEKREERPDGTAQCSPGDMLHVMLSYSLKLRG